jgi:hypothetical protein
MKRLLLMVALILVLFTACNPTSQSTVPFPPPEGYSSWEEYNQAQQSSPSTQTTTNAEQITVTVPPTTDNAPAITSHATGPGYDGLCPICHMISRYESSSEDGVRHIPHDVDIKFENCFVCHTDGNIPAGGETYGEAHKSYPLSMCTSPACHPSEPVQLKPTTKPTTDQ